jgi:hypothetical protein
MSKGSTTLSDEAARATELLKGKVVALVRRPRDKTILVEFEDGTRLFVDAVADGLELSVTEGGA